MNCLRCGKKAEASFCEDCLKVVSLPLNESPYLNTHINLNAKRSTRPTLPSKTKDEKKSSANGGYVLTIILLTILCAVLVCACLWFGRQEISLWLS